jgi:hypothetical protein
MPPHPYPAIHGASDLRTHQNRNMQRIIVNNRHFPDA